MSQVIFLTCPRSSSQTGCSRSFANVRAWGTSFRALGAGSLCRLSKNLAENGQAWRFRRSAWWAGLCAIGRIGKASRVAGSSSPHYERSFRAPERSFSMGTSRIPNHDCEHAIGKQDRYTLVPDKFFPGSSRSAVRRDHQERSSTSEGFL